MTNLNRLGSQKRFTDPWTSEQEEEMTKDYRRYGPRYMAKRLNRSVGSVKSKAHEMGLSGKLIIEYFTK